MYALGTRLPIRNVRIQEEYWRVTGPSLDIGNPARMTQLDH